MGENKTLPPYTNRGAGCTEQDSQTALVDWLQVTFFGKKSLADLKSFFGIGQLEMDEAQRALNGYHHMVQTDSIKIMWRDGEEEWHVLMSGQGCRFWEAVTDLEHGFIQLLEGIEEEMKEGAAHLTRLDLAIDDFTGLLKIPTLKGKIRRKEIVSKFRTADIHEGYRLSTSDGEEDSHLIADGITMGSRTSRFFLRIYDKKLEREAKGLEVKPETWIRTELQFRNEYADEAMKEVVNTGFNVGVVVKGYLTEYVRFTIKNKLDSNRRRWKTCGFWLDFLDAVSPLKLAKAAPDRTIETVRQWMERQVGPSVAMMYDALGSQNFFELIRKLRKDGKEKMKKKHDLMIRQYHDIHGTPKAAEEKRKQKRAEVRKALLDPTNDWNAVMKEYSTKAEYLEEHDKHLKAIEEEEKRQAAKKEKE